MEFDTIEVTVDGAVGSLTLGQPDKLNPLSWKSLSEIEAAARWLDTHDELKVVVVSGRGRAFSAGADVSSFDEATLRSAPPSREDADLGWRMARAMDELRAVAVAKIHGWCVGGGIVLASTCDLRVAAQSARFFIPEVQLGIPLAWGGIPRLVRELGPALTKELVMTCREFGPEEARQAGFLNRVVGDEDLDSQVDQLVATLVRMPKLALLATKVHTNAVSEAMASTGRNWSDADGLLAGLADPEGRQSARRYLDRMRS
ncbi:MAG TPA: enoyl-CoA hydratase/isomerase family protein [Acidimicrobiia bacterium]|nr:enoyl-CoA hydratase/isomerase family protein [Acidimicrobiia bacterium]